MLSKTQLLNVRERERNPKLTFSKHVVIHTKDHTQL